MATNFSEVYTLFLSQIDDYELASVELDELEGLMLRYLLNATTSLQDSMINLDEISMEDKHFGTDLTLVEKAIFAKAMKLEWVREKKYSAELMQKSIGDRDFRAVQGSSYLRELTAVERNLQDQIRQQLIDYSFRDEFLSGWLT